MCLICFGKDKFGNKLYFNQVDEKHFTVQVQVPITDQFFGWLCGLGRRVKIISPLRIQSNLRNIWKKSKICIKLKAIGFTPTAFLIDQ
jgi:hypothetical protein